MRSRRALLGSQALPPKSTALGRTLHQWREALLADLGGADAVSRSPMRVSRTTRDEMETTITFNRHRGVVECCTADPAMMRRWRRAGGPVEVLRRYPGGEPRQWQARNPE